MEVSKLFRAYIDNLNQRDWAGIEGQLSDGVLLNGRSLTREGYLSSLREAAGTPKSTKWIVDVLMCGDEAGSVAARIIAKPGGDTGGSSPESSTYAKHLFCWFTESKLKEIREIYDVDAMANHQTEILKAPTWSGKPPSEPVDLKGFYQTYIDCINAQMMASDLDKFCQPVVTHNGIRMTIEEYRLLIETSQEAISGLTFNIHTTIVNDKTQQLAARIEFTGTPAREWAGARPNGRPVEFSEHVFYWLDDGKIKEVVSLVDLKTYREQLQT